MIFKKIIKSLSILLIASSLSSKIYAAEECFEKASRSIFKFNMMVDDAIIEPIAKGYNKLPKPLKKELAILRTIFQHFYRYQHLCFKEILTNSHIQLEA